MENATSNTAARKSGLLSLILFRFLPYWPLFAVLLVLCGAAAWTYAHFATPVYEVSATVLLKDESKGVDDSRSVEFLNIYASKKIVENEIEVIGSRTIMKEVVHNLNLYAPVSETGAVKTLSAYNSSPVTIEARDPDHLQEFPKIPFTFTGTKIHLNNQGYLLNQWVSTPYGPLRFSPNIHRSTDAKGPLYFSLIQPKKVVNDLLSGLDVSAASKLSTVITLTLKDEVPQRGEDILNEITAAYNRAAINDKNVLAANTLAFVEDRLKVVATSLDSIERTIQEYKSEKGAIDLGEQGKLFLQSAGTNDQKVADISTQLAVLDQVEKYVVSKNAGAGIVPATLGVGDPVLKQLLDKLSEAELQYENLKQTIPENNSILVSLKKEIEQIRPRVLENIHNQQAALQVSKTNMNATGNAVSSVLQTIPYKERKLLEISRQQSIMSNVYSFLLQKREEMTLSNASKVTDSRIVDKGESSTIPVSPKKWFIYLAGLACGMGLGIAIVMAKELLNSRILFRSDIEKYTSLPVAAEIAQVKSRGELVVNESQNPSAAEQFRQLRASIGLYDPTGANKKLMITSSIAGEGKSFIIANLALSLAGSGKKVLLVDLDLRNPRSSFTFGVANDKGVAEWLSDGVNINDVIHKTSYDNLSVMPAGKVSANATELLLKGDLQALFAGLETLFDHILIDTSPVDPVTDAFILSKYADKTLFVIRHGYTPKTIIQLLDDNSKIRGFKNLSIVYNGVKKRGFVKTGYGFGYGYGYEYVYRRAKAGKNNKRDKPQIV